VGLCPNVNAELLLFLSLLPECDISVSKLLGFETFPFFLMVSVSVSKIFGIEKSIGIGFEKIWYRKKVSVSVSKHFVLRKDTNIHDLFHHLEP